MKLLQWIFSLAVSSVIVIGGALLVVASTIFAFCMSAISTISFLIYGLAVAIKDEIEEREMLKDKNRPRIK